MDCDPLLTLGININFDSTAMLRRRLVTARESGYTYVYPGSAIGQPRAVVEETARVLSGEGFLVHSIHFLHLLPPPDCAPSAIFDQHQSQLDLAALLGARHVTCHLAWMQGLLDERLMGARVVKAYQREAAVDPARASLPLLQAGIRRYGGIAKVREAEVIVLRHLCAQAAQRRITPTLETACMGPRGHDRTATRLLRTIAEVGAENLGICIDSGHLHRFGIDVAKQIRRAGGRFCETHFHDNFGRRDLHRPVGIGTIDWLEVIKALRAVQFPGPISFECCPLIEADFEDEMRAFAANWRTFVANAAALQASGRDR